MTLGARIRKARGKTPRQKLATLVGKSTSTLKNWEDDRNAPSDGDLMLLAKETGHDFTWLKTGQGREKRPNGQTEAAQHQPAQATALVGSAIVGELPDPYRPYHVVEDIIEYPYRLLGDRAEAGSGADNTHPDPEYEALVRSQAEVRRYTGLPAARLKAFFVVGNSMTPEIQPNTAALYLPTERVEGAGMYILTLDDLTVVKVVDVLAGGVLLLSSKNKADFPRDELLVPLPESDSENMYRSEVSGQVCSVKVEGRVVMYTKVT